MDTPLQQTPIPPQQDSTFKQVLAFLKDPNNKTALNFIKTLVKVFCPHPIWKLVGDISIAFLCIGSVIYCANNGFIEKNNVQSLLALIIGAVVGSRFKGD